MTAETPAIRRKRLMMRAGHRGTREMDLILGGWAKQHLEGADPAMLDRFEALMEENDQDLYQWVSGQAADPARHTAMLDALRDFVDGQKKLSSN